MPYVGNDLPDKEIIEAYPAIVPAGYVLEIGEGRIRSFSEYYKIFLPITPSRY